MEEVKLRIESIDGVCKAEIGPLRVQMAEEFCYLQLRMICEVIAIACLVMHGNLKPKAKLLRTHKADWIISELEKLHPDFYPEALEPFDDYIGDRPQWTTKKSGFLSKAELSSLWNRHCGKKLHRGSAENVLKRKADDDFPSKVLDWRIKIVRLLERHTIITPDQNWVCYVAMNSPKVGGNVGCKLFRKIGEVPRE